MHIFDTLFPRRTQTPNKRRAGWSNGFAAPRHQRANFGGRLGGVEQLEQRELLAVAIARTSANLRFSIDTKSVDQAFGEYQSFQIANDNVADLTDVWVRVTNFPVGQKVQLGPGEDGLYYLGDLDKNESKIAYIYFVAETTTFPVALDPQTFTAEVWEGVPGIGTQKAAVNDLFQWVADAVEDDSSSRTDTVTVAYDYLGYTGSPIVGGTMTMTVTGDVKNKPDRILFSPATTLDWPADAFVLETADVTYTKTPQLPDGSIFEKPIASKPKGFTAVFTFRITAVTSTETIVSPKQYTANGADLASRKFDTSRLVEGVVPIPRATYAVGVTKQSFRSGVPVDTYLAGEPLTYEIVITNIVPTAITPLVITDQLPVGLDFAQTTISVDYGSNSPPIVPITVSPTGLISGTVSMVAGGPTVVPITITVSTTVLADFTGVLTNTVDVLLPDGTTASATEIDYPDLTLVVDKQSKRGGVSVDTYVPGGLLDYVIRITNTTSLSGTGIILSDLLPAELQVLGLQPVDWGGNPEGTVTIVGNTLSGVADIATGTSIEITVNTQVLLTADGPIANTFMAQVPLGRSFSDDDVDYPDVILALTKESSSPAGIDKYVPGAAFQYVMTITNNGAATATAVQVNDNLPAQLNVLPGEILVDWGGNVPGVLNLIGSSISGTVIIAPATTITITINTVVPRTATGTMDNEIEATLTWGPSSTATDSDTASPTADLYITKTNPTGTYIPGGTTIYTITVGNLGPSNVTGATVEDIFPGLISSATWTVAYTGGASGDPGPGSGNINTVVTIPVGGTVVYTVTATIRSSASGALINTATVAPPTGTTDPVLANNTATDTTVPRAVRNALVSGTDDGCGTAPLVRIIDQVTGNVLFQFLAYEPNFRGGVRVATADLNGDGLDEIVTAPGRGRVGEVRVWTQLGVLLGSYTTFPFGTGFRGGVEVATGDVNGDGRDDIVTGMSTGGTTVSVFLVNPTALDPVQNIPSRTWAGFPGTYTGGVTIAVGDFGTFNKNGVKTSSNPDTKSEVVVGTNSGIVAQVNIYSLINSPKVVGSFRPIATGYTGGVTLSTGRYDADEIPDIIVGAGLRGSSIVEIYSGTTFTRQARMTAFSTFFKKPNAKVYVTSLDTNGDGRLDMFYAVQGLQGENGTKGVAAWNLSGTPVVLSGTSGILPVLRITNMTKRQATFPAPMMVRRR
jgi:uncharacterized repeat protein (TIGR01451 family)